MKKPWQPYALHILDVVPHAVLERRVVDHLDAQPHARQRPFQVVRQSRQQGVPHGVRFGQGIEHGIEAFAQDAGFGWA